MVDRVRESGETVTSIRRERGWLEIVTGEFDEEATESRKVVAEITFTDHLPGKCQYSKHKTS